MLKEDSLKKKEDFLLLLTVGFCFCLFCFDFSFLVPRVQSVPSIRKLLEHP